jgi:uncharacterized protein
MKRPRLTRRGSVVRPRGAVGVIIDTCHAYRVRFAHGAEASVRRSELSIRKHFQRDGLVPADALDERDFESYIIYCCIIGSRAYGLNDDASDTDRRGV